MLSVPELQKLQYLYSNKFIDFQLHFNLNGFTFQLFAIK